MRNMQHRRHKPSKHCPIKSTSNSACRKSSRRASKLYIKQRRQSGEPNFSERTPRKRRTNFSTKKSGCTGSDCRRQRTRPLTTSEFGRRDRRELVRQRLAAPKLFVRPQKTTSS